LALILGLASAPARAAVTLVRPVELEKKVDDIKDTINNTGSDPLELTQKVQSMFDQAQGTHHLQVSGIGEELVKDVETVSEAGTPATLSSMLDKYRSLVIQEPPNPRNYNEKLEGALM